MVDRQLLFVTTLITTKYLDHDYSASGFFFQKDLQDGETDLISNYWLVTNRHVIYAKDDFHHKKYLMDSLTFRVRAEEKGTSKLTWIEVTLSKDDLRKKTKVLSNYGIDVAVIDIRDRVKEALGKIDDVSVTIAPITESNLADKSKMPIEVCDDLMVIGYPKGYYDMANLYPIVKNGTIASMWAANFRGTKGFAIDAKLFPGSSGSLVISKPRTEDLDDKGFLVFKKEKIFYCLGIYSGQPLFNGETLDLGQVWYYSLIPETINNGVQPVDEYTF